MPPKRRRRFQGLYYHSSPPKVLPMNGQLPNDSARKRRGSDDMSVKLSTIRIWMHEKEIGKLTRILWAGQGNRLRQQASTNPKVKRFLAAVPYVMNSIRDVHQAVIDNSLENLQAHLEPPVPPALVTCRDANGLNLIHKAAGLGHATILEYLITTWPDGVHECDITGKTPLHWAASAKNNMRCYTLLTQAGCDEEAVDYKMKTPSFYRHKPHEIERAFLTYVPEAPRVSPDVATDWEALSDDSGDGKKPDIKIPEMNGFGRHSNAESNENTSEAEMTEGASAAEDDDAGGGDEEALTEEPEKEESAAEEPEKPVEEEKEDEEKPAEDDAKDEEEEEGKPLEDENEESQANDDEQAAQEQQEEEEPQDEKQTQSVNEANAITNDNESDKAEPDDEDNEKQNEEEESVNNEENSKDTVIEKAKEEEVEQQQQNGKEDEKEEDETNEKDEEMGKESGNETTKEDEEKDKENEKEINESEEEKGNETIKETKEEKDANGKENEKEAEEGEETKEESKSSDTHAEEKEAEEDLETYDSEKHDESKDKMNENNIKENDDQNKEEQIADTEQDKKPSQSDLETMEKDENENNNNNGGDDGDERQKKIEKDSIESESNDIVVVGNSNTPNSKHKLNGNGSGKSRGKHHTPGGGGGENSSDDTEDDEENETEEAGDDDDDGSNGQDQEQDDGENEPNNDENEPNNEEANENDDENNDEEGGENNDEEENAENADEDAADDDDGDGAESPTSSLAIEGFVEGAADDNTESRISRIIASGDMEQLAQIVLNGDGQKLLNVEAKEAEIQAFLRNVPNYMDKIRRVHEAARGGSLLNLQQALDRRKFAVAKDEISPNGATPLHVAVLFGHSDIVRYLSARFPETTSVTDNDGRTALHYAAVINDNGHFYNVLQQLGANPKAQDNMGRTPEQYMTDNDQKDTFNYGLLLKNFGAEELEEKLLSDQGKIENHSFEENPIFKTEQGKYLAENLADPLIKALTQVAQKRPQDPLQYLTNYLQTFVAQRNTNGRTVVQAAVHSGSSHTDSTGLANDSPIEQKQIIPTARMNGHVTHDKTEDIETDTLQQQIDDEDADEAESALSKRLEERDEHGQSMLHFASARSHRRGGLLQLIEESKVDITYRDELYRTARDVALQANQVVNAKDIDRYLISLAIVGDVKPFEYFAIAGYDHIIDVLDEDKTIIEVAESKGHTELVSYLRAIRPMEEMREELHQMIRDHKVDRAKEISAGPEGKWLIMARNYYGRTALHIAILKEDEELVEHFVKICPEALKIGDNLERSPLHYAMGTNLVEGISRILIQNGAKRTNKDLKGRQPSYYFMNKADILRLQEEEDESR
ncbi:uncharacterized protein isoform X12 [Musca autumnalis]|uniref:uncharacterized protein isoform X12 n=1 Tax=Musca autumnalis TaxID=221902 RepID=UPI003CF69E1D